MTKKEKLETKKYLEEALINANRASKLVYNAWSRTKNKDEEKALYGIMINANHATEAAARACWAYESLIKKEDKKDV